MLIESGDLIPVVRDAIEIPWTKRKLQILQFLLQGPVNFQTYVYDTNVGDIAQLSTYFNPEKWNLSDLNERFANQSTYEQIQEATVNSQGPNTTNTSVSPGDLLPVPPGTPVSSGGKIKSSSLLPRLMVLAPTSQKPITMDQASEEVLNEDFKDGWSSFRTSVDAFDLSPLDTPAGKATIKNTRQDSGVIQGSEKLNEKVFLNCGNSTNNSNTPKLLTPDYNEVSKALFNLELVKKLVQEQVSPANSCSSRSSSRAGSRPVSRQSSLSCGGGGSGRATPSLLTRTPSLRDSRHSSGISGVSPLSVVTDTAWDTEQQVKNNGIPEGLRFLLERRNSGHTPSTPPPPPPAFDPAQPPPSLPTRMTYSSGLNSPFALGSLQFSTPPPGYSTGLPKLDLALNKIGDGRPDRLLAPWTVAGSILSEDEVDKTTSKKRSTLADDDVPVEDSIPLFEVVDIDTEFQLALTDDNDALRAKGIRMKRVRPLVEHSPQGCIFDHVSSDFILDLPSSKYFDDL